MKTEAQAVIIGGGVYGCSVAYHLTALGWRDVPFAAGVAALLVGLSLLEWL